MLTALPAPYNTISQNRQSRTGCAAVAPPEASALAAAALFEGATAFT
jgi:hypothetical protein